jgi:pimeloyl-[acyl-carrier protein] methyl ester esterase
MSASSYILSRSFGDPGAPPLVLLHGLGFDGNMWSHWCEALSGDFYVLAPDLPGYGQSADQSSTAMAEDVKALLEVLPPSAHYIGWSLGGLMAMWIAARHPSRVHCMVSICATPCFKASEQWKGGISAEDFAKFQSIATRGDKETVGRRLTAIVTRGERNPEHWQNLIRPLMHIPDHDSLQSGLDILWQTDLREALKHTDVPMMHLLGDNDAMLSPMSASALKDLASNQNVALMEHTSHALPWSRQTHAITLIRKFIMQADGAISKRNA